MCGVVWFISGWLVGNFKVVCFNLGLWLVEVWFRVKVRFGFGLVSGWVGVVRGWFSILGLVFL